MAIISGDQITDRPVLGDCISDSDCGFGMECVFGICKIASSTCIEGATSTETSYPATGYIKFTTLMCVGGVMTSTGVDYFCDTEAGYGRDPAYSSVTCTINNRCTGCIVSCSCSSVGYSGSCSGTNYSTCYTSCSKPCTQQSCPSNATCTHGSTSTTGTQYYGGSCSASASTCSITVTCNPGFYLSNGTCAKCEAGYYCPGNNSRGQCSSGYTSAAGAASCSPITVNCPAGQFMWWWGGYTYCEPCHPNYYCPGGINVYGSGSTNSANSAGVVPIYSCPSGYTANTTYGKSAASQCQIAVAAGQYLTTQNGTTTANCTSGTYKAAHNVNYGSTDSCTSCPSPSVSGSIYVYGGSTLSPTGATAATQCYLDTNVADYWTHNVEYRGFYRCSGKQYYSASTGYYSNCESKKYFSECNAGYFIDNSVAMNSEFSNSCTICGAGTYTEKYSTASNIGDGSYHYQTSCSLCPAGTYNPNTGSTSASACTECPNEYKNGGAGTASQGACVGAFTKTGSQLDPEMQTGCSTRTLTACTPGTCTYYKNYAGTITSDCTPTNCTKGQCCTSVAANYYITTSDNCTATPCSNYADYPLSDGGNITSAYCYKNVTLTGQQLEPTMMTGCNTRTLSACTPGTCTYKDYRTATDSVCTPTDCTKGQCCTSASANYYISSTDNCTAKSCSANYANYPYSDGGEIGNGYCYENVTLTGMQTACSQPENSASYTCGTCTPGTCTYKDYHTATDTPCTPTDCTQPVNPGSVVCNTGYYTYGTTCPACTNAPSNSLYTGTATSNDCPWECDDGYNLTSDNQCAQYCAAGVTHIHLGTGLKIPLYSVKRTTPSINVRHNGTVCYADLIEGESTGLHVKYNGKTYHAAE